MSTPRKRKIQIYLTPRATTDSPELLNQVAHAFPEDDLTIKITDQPEETLEPVEHQLAKDAQDGATDALDLQDQGIKQGFVPVKSLEQARDFVRQLWKDFSQEGVKTTARVIFSSLLKSFFG